MIDLIVKWAPSKRVTVAARTGWVEGFAAFVLGDGTVIGAQDYVFQPAGMIAKNGRGMQMQGTLEAWRTSVAALCLGNPLPVFYVAAAFAGPLLDLIDVEGDVFSSCSAARRWARPRPW